MCVPAGSVGVNILLTQHKPELHGCGTPDAKLEIDEESAVQLWRAPGLVLRNTHDYPWLGVERGAPAGAIEMMHQDLGGPRTEYFGNVHNAFARTGLNQRRDAIILVTGKATYAAPTRRSELTCTFSRLYGPKRFAYHRFSVTGTD